MSALADQMSISPDSGADGFVTNRPDPLRYDGHGEDPYEVGGLLTNLVPKGARVLDVGCGTGALSRIIARKREARVFGIEPDECRAHVASHRGVDVTVGYLSPDYFETNGQFDVIIFADVLEHVAAPERLLQVAKMGLNRSGVILVSVPNVAHWSVRLNLAFGRFEYEDCGIMDATHLRWFTRRTLVKLLEHAGLSVERVVSTAGVGLPIYQRAVPWRWAPQWRRRQVIASLVRAFPNLFACQFVARAKPAASP